MKPVMWNTRIPSTRVVCATVIPVLALLAPSPTLAFELGAERDCVIVPHRVVDVSSAVPGLLESVSIERSDRVARGQELARLESAVERASLALAEAWASIESEVRLESITRALDHRRKERVERLYRSQAVALDDKDQAETDASLAEVRLRQAHEKRWIRSLDASKAEALLERRTVRSPIDGVVVERYRSGGEYVENQPIARIAQLHPLQVETILPMRAFGSVRPGMQAVVRAENDPEQAHTATVSVVDRVGDAASGTFGVRLSLPNPEHRVPAGLKCTLSFLPVQATEAMPPPAAAVPEAEHAPAPPPAGDASEEGGPPAGPETLPLPLPAAQHVRTNADPIAPRASPPAVDAASSVDSATSTAPPAAPPAARDVAADLAATAAGGAACRAIGPLDSEHAALELVEGLRSDGAEAVMHEAETRVTFGYIVVSAPGAEDGALLVERMRAAGVSDLLLMPAGEFRDLVSVGTFAREPTAERRRTEIAALGFDAEVRPRTRREPRWWVAVRSAPAHPLATLAGDAGPRILPCSEEGVPVDEAWAFPGRVARAD